jgi:hypothetical protein
VGADLHLEFADIRAVNLQGENPEKDSLRMLTAKFSPSFGDVHLLLADWWRRTAAGFAIAVDHWDATWRLEALQFSKERITASETSKDPAMNQWGAGVERAFGAKWTVVAEYFQQSSCQDLHSGYALTPPTRLQVLNGCRYFLPYADYQINAAWKAGAGSLFNIGDPSAYGILNLEYIWSDTLSLVLKAKWAFGRGRGEFGPERYQDPYGHAAGAQSTVYAGLTYTM